jgi:hypothetical protein
MLASDDCYFCLERLTMKMQILKFEFFLELPATFAWSCRLNLSDAHCTAHSVVYRIIRSTFREERRLRYLVV